MKKILVVSILVLVLSMFSVNIIAEPVVEEVTIDPSEPKALDTITITAKITSDETIDEVEFRIKECDENMCMVTESYEMVFVNGNYVVTDELTYSEATYFSYQFIITSNETETEIEFEDVNLKPAEQGGSIDENGNGDNEIPVFVYVLIIVVIIVVVVIFAIFRKKDKK
jgi:hypothetical protein